MRISPTHHVCVEEKKSSVEGRRKRRYESPSITYHVELLGDLPVTFILCHYPKRSEAKRSESSLAVDAKHLGVTTP